MIELERLYDCAEQHLHAKQKNWDKFAHEFQKLFGAKMSLSQPVPVVEGYGHRSKKELIVTTDDAIMEQYYAQKIYELDTIPADTPNALEPIRRTDVLDDEMFLEQKIAQQFSLPNGIFYLMAVFAILRPSKYLLLIVWRDENENDFSNIEKQRLALFMRFLSVIVAPSENSSLSGPSDEISGFGRKYSLTQTEVEILSHLLAGESLRAIADKSARSYGTVRWHVRNILNKCQVSTQKNLLSEFYQLIKR